MLHTDFMETRFLYMADTRQTSLQNMILARAICNEGYGDGADCKVMDITQF